MNQRRCLVLFSGGLDSMLAVCLLREQGIAVQALNFKTIFTCCQDQAGRAAHALGVPLTVLSQQEDYLTLVRSPRFGYGKGANPCVDCRIYMFQRAGQYLAESGADFVASGEVLGQRPMSQKRRDLDRIAFHSGLHDRLLRPLSAKRLPPTLPERSGWVDRQQLCDFVGRGRKGLIRLARRFGLTEIPSPSTGCVLTEVNFSRKVFDLIRSPGGGSAWEFELLKLGRHFRFDDLTKVVVGRQETENELLGRLHHLPDAGSSVCLSPADFPGPRALLLGPPHDVAVQFAIGLIVRYAGRDSAAGGHIRCEGQLDALLPACGCPASDRAVTLANPRPPADSHVADRRQAVNG